MEKHIAVSGEKKLADLFSLYFPFLVFVFVFTFLLASIHWRVWGSRGGARPSVCNVYVFYHYCPLGKKKKQELKSAQRDTNLRAGTLQPDRTF